MDRRQAVIVLVGGEDRLAAEDVHAACVRDGAAEDVTAAIGAVKGHVGRVGNVAGEVAGGAAVADCSVPPLIVVKPL